MQILKVALLSTTLFGFSAACAQELFDYNPPALGSSEAVKRRDLDLELDGINTDKTDFVDIDTSAEIRAIMTDELGTGVLFFLGAPGADDQAFISDSVSAGTWRSIPDSDGPTQKLQYDVTTNAFTAGTDDDIPDAADYTNLSATLPITQAGGTISTSMTTSRLIGRTTAATGVMEEISVGSTLSLSALNLGVATNGITITQMADDSIGIDELDLIDGDTPVNGDCLTYDTGAGGTIEAIPCPGAGGGDSISVEDGDNAGTSTAAVDPTFEDSGDINFVLTAADISGLVRANSVALVTDTTGNIVTNVADGTGIDGTCATEDCTYTPTLDMTELNTFTLGAGAATGIIFDTTTSLPAIEVASGAFTFDIGGTNEVVFTSTTARPGANDGSSLGVSGTAWADLFLAAGGLIEFDGGTTNTFTCTGGGCTIEGVTLAKTTDVTNKTESLCIAASDETTAITVGTAKTTFRMPYAFTLTGIRGSLNTASSSGSPIIDVNEAGTSIMTTNKILIDVNEKTSVTAVTAPTITDSALADDAEMTIDVDTAGTNAKGLKVCLIGHQ